MIIIILKGFGMGLGLIAAIGAQNAFVLSQGIKKEYNRIILLICCTSDMLLITAGIAGVGTIFQSNPMLFKIAKYGGSLFLFWYGLKSLISVFRSSKLDTESKKIKSLKQAVLTTLAVTLLNPHIYLDTVILLGSVSTQYIGINKLYFGIGAITASILWFFSLSIGGRVLAPLFKNPISWKILDSFIGIMMWYIAFGLFFLTI